MELRDVTVAVVRGGGFHAEDFLFASSRAELASSVQTRIRQLSKGGAFSLSTSIDKDGDIKIGDQENDRFEAFISSRGIVWRVQRVPFLDLTMSDGGVLAPAIAVLDSLVGARRQVEQWDTYGVRLDFAIPLLEPKAIEFVESLGLEAIDKRVGSSFGVDSFRRLKYECAFEIDGYQIEVTVASTSDKRAIVFLVDSRTSDTKSFSGYPDFIKRTLNAIVARLPRFASSLLGLTGVDEQYLKRGVK